MTTGPRHFLDIDQLDEAKLRAILRRAVSLKAARNDDANERPLAGKTLALIFERPSTRTRVSFEVGMRQLGGDVVVLSGTESQIGRGETIADTARVLSRYVDAIMLRTDDPARLVELAHHAAVPVINGLTSRSHPCQVMSDILTFEEHRGAIKGRVIAWSGDGNNVAESWVHAAVRFGFELRLACPESLTPRPALLEWAAREGGHVTVGHDATAAVRMADGVVTDTWISMSQAESAGSGLQGEAARRHNLLAPFQVNERLMDAARPDALFMHCLPAHRGEEVTAEVIDGPRSVVWDEAENRLHAQKGILAFCLGV